MATLDWSDRADPTWLSHALSGWRDAEGPLYTRIAEALRRLIDDGEVEAGSRLSPERDLARALGVSRSTVIAAYDRLADDGLVERRQGSGTWIREEGAAGVRRAADRRGFDRTFRLHPRPGDAIVDLTVAGPEMPEVVRDAFHAAAMVCCDELGGHGYSSHGHPALRRAVAGHLTGRGVATQPDDVMITHGAHQAVALVAAHLLSPGDVFAMEDPGYAGSIDIAEVLGARAAGMALDAEGVRPDEIERAVTRRGARLLHIVPTGQNPTGAVMGPKRRSQVARVVADLGVPLIEDTVFEDVALRSRHATPIAALAPTAPVVMIGSFSKLFWGGLRVGWLRAPGTLLDRLVRLKMVHDHGTSMASQVIALRLMDHLDDQQAAMRAHLADRSAQVARLVADLLPGWEFHPPQAGLSAWLRLPSEDATPFSRFARRMGVAVVPGSAMSPSGGFEDHLRVSLGPPADMLDAGLRRLAEAWDVYSADSAFVTDEVAARC